MSNQPRIHTELLQRQMGELFRAVYDRGIHRSKFNEFKPLVVTSAEGISYSHEFVGEGKQKSRSTIQVHVGPRKFLFCQNYNFGVMQAQESLLILDEDSPDHNPHVLIDYLTDESVDEEQRKTTSIEFEYAISLATESVAANLAVME